MATEPFDFRNLRYAIAAAEFGSFRRAAERLNVKQSTLSRRIFQMEQRLGVALFDRTRIGVRPTVAGTDFLSNARRIVSQAENMKASANAAGRGDAGRLTLGFYTSLSAGNLRETLVDYKRRRPMVEVRVIQENRRQLVSDVISGLIDIAIVLGDPTSNDVGTLALWSERILVALPESHPLATRSVVSWSELKGETFLLGRYYPGQDFQDLLISKLAAPGDHPEVVQNEVSGEAIKSLVGAGFGVSLLCDACLGATHAGVVYREARDGNGPCRIGYMAQWDVANKNPMLASFLKLLRERYPTGG